MRFAPAAWATSVPVCTLPVNAMRSTQGCAVRAAPASSPMPCTTLKAPSGPASCAMSASIEAVSGAHSGGQNHRVPGGERGRDTPGREHERGVPRRDHDRDPLGSQATRSANPRSPWCRSRARAAGPRRTGSCGRPASPIPSWSAAATRCRGSPRPRARGRAPRRRRRGDAAPRPAPWRRRGPRRSPHGRRRPLDRPPRRLAGDLGDQVLVDRRDVGEGAGRPDALPPIQCSVETSMPSTTTRLVALPSPRTLRLGRSFASERYGGRGCQADALGSGRQIHGSRRGTERVVPGVGGFPTRKGSS